MNHETEHAQHFRYGFQGVSLERFDFSNIYKNLLFSFVTEVLVHGTHIQALGLANPQSAYPRRYQQFLINEMKKYLKQAADLFNSERVNPNILSDVRRNFSKLRFRTL